METKHVIRHDAAQGGNITYDDCMDHTYKDLTLPSVLGGHSVEGGKLENKQWIILYSGSIMLKSKTNIKYFKVSLVKNAKFLYTFVCLPHFMRKRKNERKK